MSESLVISPLLHRRSKVDIDGNECVSFGNHRVDSRASPKRYRFVCHLREIILSPVLRTPLPLIATYKSVTSYIGCVGELRTLHETRSI